MQIEYRGETIRYDEDSNLWQWRAESKALDSLKAIKRQIDRAIDGESGKPKFTHQPALFWASWGEPKEVTVTSRTDDGAYWAMGAGGRGKYKARDLFAASESNRALLAEWRRLDAEKEAIEEKQRETRAAMAPFAPEGKQGG